tara:strand:+ start:303 stop:554 length:252 start_codon:yes stop_codon:yes gene_type:complete
MKIRTIGFGATSRFNSAFITAVTMMTTLSAIALKLTVAPIIDMMAVSVFAALGAFLALSATLLAKASPKPSQPSEGAVGEGAR